MPRISTTTASKQAITRTVTSSLRSNLDELSRKVGESLFPAGVPDAFDLGVLFLALADTLDRDYNAVAAADREVARELGEDQRARALRDERAEALRESLFQVRALVNVTFGAEHADGLGLAGRIPDHAEALVPFARNAATKLAVMDAPADLPGFVHFDPAAAAAELQAQAQALDDALSELARDLRETQAVQSEHGDANAIWQRHHGPIARIIEGCFALAGMAHQADRVRPSRRSAARPEPDDAVVDGGGVGGGVGDGGVGDGGVGDGGVGDGGVGDGGDVDDDAPDVSGVRAAIAG